MKRVFATVFKGEYIYSGKYMGDMVDGKLMPSHIVAQENESRIIISNKAAEHFISGHDLDYSAVIEDNSKDNFVTVYNRKGDYIGYGIKEVDRIRNLRSIGEFLRESKS